MLNMIWPSTLWNLNLPIMISSFFYALKGKVEQQEKKP